ncbi:MAG: DEAD/DEAH box helicase [Pirellulales bacterium]
MDRETVDRDELATQYLEGLPYVPYPVQEEAILTWYTSQKDLLVSAPTGTGKTLIAEAAIYEALKTGRRLYYTTPLIALTEQKLQELQSAARRWGFSPADIGLVTGNRRVNPNAPVLVVVAEILFNRLLHPEEFAFHQVSAVVMDEFHSFNDPERGIVWEFSLGLLPKHVRLMLLSATVGNAVEFVLWMHRTHGRDVDLVRSEQRRVALTFQWVGDQLLNEQIEIMARGNGEFRFTPALIFCFNRDECWNVAEQLKGKGLLEGNQQQLLADALQRYDWSTGAGPKLRQILQRGVGVHHAGLLPKYKRVVEELFQQKLLTVTVCTETLAAGINLPARSVVVPSLLKGPPNNKRLIDPSSAHQMFGRAGRPQFDTMGFVFALAHEDDVKILRWREKYDQIPEDTKDPNLLRAKKAMKKKMPTRRNTEKYWSEEQFRQLCAAPPAKLQSCGAIPWRLLAHMLEASPDVELIRHLVSKRLMPPKQLEAAQQELTEMLLTLSTGAYVQLEPPPGPASSPQQPATDATAEAEVPSESAPELKMPLIRGWDEPSRRPPPPRPVEYRPKFAYPTERLQQLIQMRSVNPLYGLFLVHQLGIAAEHEILQAFESVLEMPGSVARYVRVPRADQLPPGPLATERLDPLLLQMGLATPEELGVSPETDDDEEQDRWEDRDPRQRVWPLTLADKLWRLFQNDFPAVQNVPMTPVWVAGEVLTFGGDFNKYITSNQLSKQEGILFRHLLRLILLLSEFAGICPVEREAEEWKTQLLEIRNRLVECCRGVDPTSVDTVLQAGDEA